MADLNPNTEISFAGTFVSGAFAACFAELCTIPLDTAKVRLQLQKKANMGDGADLPKYRGMLGTVVTIAMEEGLVALWKGIVPGLHRQCLYGGLRIGLYDPVKAFYVGGDFVGDVSLFVKILAALTTGALAIAVANPTDLVKVRLQAEGKLPAGVPRRYSGALNAYLTIVRQEGLGALWTGLGPNIARNAIINAAELASYDQVKQTVLKIPGFTDNILTHLLAGLGAGFFAVCIGSPVDVVKSRMMGDSTYKSTLDCFVKTLKNEEIIMSNILASTDLSRSESSSSSDSDGLDELGELMIMNMLVEYEGRFFGKNPMRTSQLTGREYMVELLNGHPRVCYDMFRMDKDLFIEFCRILRERNFLERTDEISIEESVAMFLFIIGHNVGQRVAGDRFQHSIETVSRHFKNVLRAVCRYGKELIAPSTNNDVPLQIRDNSKYYPWFKDCIGAIDGTHVSAWVPTSKQIPYRGRKVLITQNVMCACSFDMMFTFAYSGWEGTANDSRVFLDAITRPEAGFPIPPTGKYYVVDSGYPCTMGFLPPYRGERYHLQEYRGGRSRQPRTPRELFNYRHSSLRNVIERCFGVLKARFPILKLMPKYPLVRQRLIVIACCAIHNFIRQKTQTDNMFAEYEREDLEVENSNDANSSQPVDGVDFSDAHALQMAAVRDEMSNSMWALYTANG